MVLKRQDKNTCNEAKRGRIYYCEVFELPSVLARFALAPVLVLESTPFAAAGDSAPAPVSSKPRFFVPETASAFTVEAGFVDIEEVELGEDLAAADFFLTMPFRSVFWSFLPAEAGFGFVAGVLAVAADLAAAVEDEVEGEGNDEGRGGALGFAVGDNAEVD